MELELFQNYSYPPPPVPAKALDLKINSFGGVLSEKVAGGGRRHDKSKISTETVLTRQWPLVWSGQPNEGDDPTRKRRSFTTAFQKDMEEDKEIVVGWPPVNNWRRKLLHGGSLHVEGCGIARNHNNNTNRGGGDRRRRLSTFTSTCTTRSTTTTTARPSLNTNLHEEVMREGEENQQSN